MIYYRIAARVQPCDPWQWRSTILTSLDSVMSFLRLHDRMVQQRMQISFASQPAILNIMLDRFNDRLPANVISIEQIFACNMKIDTLAMALLEAELGVSERVFAKSGIQVRQEHTNLYQSEQMCSVSMPLVLEQSYDEPYLFTLPSTLREMHVWTNLLARVQRGELAS